jgi:hypothetical protein
MDFTDIGLMGHSRGGEGVVMAGILNENLVNPWHIKAVLPLAPSDFNRETLPDVTTATILPYCDGDVSDQQGQHFEADSRNGFSDDVLRSNVWVMGADHDFFNTVWTPPAPTAADDWLSPDDPVCGMDSPTSIRLSAAQEYQVGTAYVAGFFESTLDGQRQYLPMFDGTGALPPSVAAFADIRTVVTQPAALREDVTTFVDPSPLVSTTGATATICASSRNEKTAPAVLPYCGGSLTASQVPHWAPAYFVPDVPIGRMTHLTWTRPGGALTVTVPANERNVTRFAELSVDVAADENVPDATDLVLSVTDSAGRTYRVPVSRLNPLAVRRLPASGSDLLGKIVLQEVRVPTTALAAAGLDLSRISRIGFTSAMAVGGGQAGGVYLSDLSFDRTGTGAPGAERRPHLGLAPATIDEPSGPGTARMAVYLSSPSRTPTTVYVTAPPIGGGATAASTQWVRFAPGQTCRDVSFPVAGQSVPTTAPDAVYTVRLSDSTNAVLSAAMTNSLTIRNTASSAHDPATGVGRDACAVYLASRQPGTPSVAPTALAVPTG